jgi:hypothetical protein
LLQAVLKYTPDDSPDKTDLPKAIAMIKTFLTKVNIESGKSENVFELAQLEQQLVFRPNESIVSTSPWSEAVISGIELTDRTYG